MNLYLQSRIESLNIAIKDKKFTEKQHFKICNKLDRLIEYIKEEC